jgi:hypothetical protein
MKPDALDRMGVYARRHEFSPVVVLISSGLGAELFERIDHALDSSGISLAHTDERDTPVAAPSRSPSSFRPGPAQLLDAVEARRWILQNMQYSSHAFPIWLCRFCCPMADIAARNPSLRSTAAADPALGQCFSSNYRHCGMSGSAKEVVALGSRRFGFRIYLGYRLEAGIPRRRDSDGRFCCAPFRCQCLSIYRPAHT